jgi:hypothetical protein
VYLDADDKLLKLRGNIQEGGKKYFHVQVNGVLAHKPNKIIMKWVTPEKY